jgi:hypothetical protein
MGNRMAWVSMRGESLSILPYQTWRTLFVEGFGNFV